MSIDSRAFRQTVGHFATGVTVIAAEVDGIARGMTANAFTSLSLDPPLVLFCAGKTSHMGLAIRAASRFSINILAETQQDLSTYFAGGWKEPSPPPFQLMEWEGSHRLDGCIAALACTTETLFDGGDHWIVVGRVTAMHRAEEPTLPLLFYRGRYASLSPPDRS